MGSEKNADNTTKHGVSFDAIHGFEWETAMIGGDTRANYGQRRFVGLGFIGRGLYVCVFADQNDKHYIVSLRKANNREIGIFNRG